DGKLTPTADTPGPFTVGEHTVTWSITDTAGNTATVTQKVTVTDTTAPRVAPPPAVVIEGTDLSTPVDPGIATAVDLVDGAVSPAPDVTGPFAVGEHTIRWSVQDQAGNTGSATQKITVRDTTAPVITVPGDVITEATNLATPVALGNATATDIVDSKLVITSDAPGTFPVGTTQVTWKATDFTGNVVSVKQRVTITDTTPPVVNTPRDITIEATGATTGVELGEAVASDLVDGNLAAKPDRTGPFAPGVHTITWRASDKAGNTGSAEQPVTVTDKTPPRIVAEADISIEATGPATPATLKVSADDLVDGAMQPTSDAPDAYPVGTTAVTWTVTDKAGNSSSVSRTITVVDTTSPLITVPADVRLEATGATTPVELGSATATDKVDGPLAPAPDQTGPFAPGVHIITWSVSDRAGNLNTATQRVFVSDKTVPVVTPPPDVVLEAAGRATSVDLGAATAVDLVDGSVAAKPDQAGPFAVGVHKITWSATDAATNTGTATQTVTVVDTTVPVLTPPADVTLEATSAKTEVALGDATATDSVDGALKATPDHIGSFAPGAHTVTWRVVDAAGNASTATQAVTITDKTAPTISAPKDLTVEATGLLTALNLGKATATDNIDGALSPVPDQAGPFAPGSYTVTWSVTDSTGNTATAIQRVTVTDTTPPEIVVPEDVVTEATGQKTTVDPGEARAVDLVDGEVAVASDAPAVYPIDTTVISWHAKDRAGNESSLTQFVTVEDRGSPVVTPPADITVESDGDETDVELGAATAVDVIDGELDAKPDKTGPFKIGVHKVTWTATDSSAKKGTATQQVTVVAPAAKPVTAMEKDQAPAAEAAVPASE
ncbi:MAG: type 3a cellulose-binding domain-containing protein, partial [Gammaproteobacteria bacterium]